MHFPKRIKEASQILIVIWILLTAIIVQFASRFSPTVWVGSVLRSVKFKHFLRPNLFGKWRVPFPLETFFEVEETQFAAISRTHHAMKKNFPKKFSISSTAYCFFRSANFSSANTAWHKNLTTNVSNFEFFFAGFDVFPEEVPVATVAHVIAGTWQVLRRANIRNHHLHPHVTSEVTKQAPMWGQNAAPFRRSDKSELATKRPLKVLNSKLATSAQNLVTHCTISVQNLVIRLAISAWNLATNWPLVFRTWSPWKWPLPQRYSSVF